jgi:NADH-quinone oxidoreductase subunit G
MPKLTIDNREVEVPAGTKVIEAAQQLGILIPRFCYHPALGSVGACRVCAVAFKDGPVQGVQMSCMVNAQDEMVVSTTDEEAVDFRRHVIEWLMLNHPHDCPVCDEGGHCLLQDLTVSGGHGMRRYRGLKRTHEDQYLGPLIQHEMNRCIQCYRCARYYQAFAGSKDLGVMGIGSRVYFGRHRPGTLESVFSGNLIDLCPTGVYTDKPSRFVGRRWDFQRAPSVCLHCSLGCNLVVSARYRRVVRHEARPNKDVNGYFICDRGRYGYAYAGAADRPRQAMAAGEVLPLPDAVAAARQALEKAVGQQGPQSVAVVGSTRNSLETLAVLDLLCHQHGWSGPAAVYEDRKARNIRAATGSLTPELAVSLGAVSVADFALVIGADPINEAPMLALSLRQAQRRGGRVAVMDPRAIEMPLEFDHLPVPPSDMCAVIDHLIHAACRPRDAQQGVSRPHATEMKAPPFDDRLDAMTSRLCSSQRAVIICGTDTTTPQGIGLAAELARTMRKTGAEAKLFYILNGPNAFAVGRMTDHSGSIETLLDQIEAGRVKALVVVENDLWHNCPDRRRLTGALAQLELMILLDHVVSPLVEKAHLFLPTQTIYEAGGHWINQEGRLEPARPALKGGTSIEIDGQGDHPPRIFQKEIPGGAPGEAWRLLSALADGSGFKDAVQLNEQLRAAMARVESTMGELKPGARIRLEEGATAALIAEEPPASQSPSQTPDAVTLLLVDWTFGTESLSSPSPPLAGVAWEPVATLHSETAGELGLVKDKPMTISANLGKLSLAWRSDDRMAGHVIVIPRHHMIAWQILGGTRLTLARSQIQTLG